MSQWTRKKMCTEKLLLSTEASHNKKGLIPHLKNIKIGYVESYVKLAPNNIRQVDISNVDNS